MSGPEPTERKRPKLSLYALDRPALKALAKELRELLAKDDRKALATLLGLGPELATRFEQGPRAVDWFLREETDAQAMPFFASLRRIAKKRALELAWTSEEASLEGRLRHFEILRQDPKTADLIDKLLDSARLPWFLVRPTATAGWLDGDRRETLATEMRGLRSTLPPELKAFAEALDAMDGAAVAHDGL